MEVALAVFSAVGTAASTAGSAVASAVGLGAAGTTTLLPAVGGWSTAVTTAGSSAFSVLQGVATAGSLLSTAVGGLSAYSEARTNAELSEIQAESERLAGQEKSLRIRRDLLQKIGANRVAFAGSGVTIGSGASIEASLEGDAEFELGLERQNARVRQLSAQMRAGRYRDQATASLIGTAGKMAGTLGNYGLDLAVRG